MTRFLFVSLPLAGHLDWGGMLSTAAALAQQPNHQVAWASEPPVAAAVGESGVEFLALPTTGWQAFPPLPAGLSAGQREALRRERALDSWLSPAAMRQAVVHIKALLANWQPDAVILEPYAAAAAFACEQMGLPIVVCGRPALSSSMPSERSAASVRVRELCADLGLTGAYWNLQQSQIYSPLLHIDYFSRHWYADLPAMAPQNRFVGSTRHPDPAPKDPPIVLITLGSLFHDDPAFFRIAAEAVMLEGGQPWVVTGRRPAESAPSATLPGLPSGCQISDWIHLDATLPRLVGIIHHGGVGTTHAALRHGLPQIAVPHAGDQQAQAGRITQAGVGYGVRPADFTLAHARWLARQVLSNETLHARAAAWRDKLQQLGGAPAAAQALEAAFSRSQFMV